MNNAMSLKAKIRNIAKEKNIPAQVVLQNYMFERFLFRLSKSEYKEKFVIKGGMLVSALVGMSLRSTMDLDTTLKNLMMTPDTIKKAIDTIASIDVEDGILYEVYSISPIRDNDVYGGYRVMMYGIMDTLKVPMSIDISTGDIITPKPVLISFNQIFFEEKIEVYAYNIETILAEKIETILRRTELNTRPRDFYDVYILVKTQNFDCDLLNKAIVETAKHRGTIDQIADIKQILSNISQSKVLEKMWEKYTKDFPYARDITYNQIIEELKKLLPNSFDDVKSFNN